jgi:hypothetical protein
MLASWNTKTREVADDEPFASASLRAFRDIGVHLPAIGKHACKTLRVLPNVTILPPQDSRGGADVKRTALEKRDSEK